MTSKIALGEGFPLHEGSGRMRKRKPVDIIERKRREIAEAGHALWGYGGSTCHPVSMVQPASAGIIIGTEGAIYLLMELHGVEPLRIFPCVQINSPINGLKWGGSSCSNSRTGIRDTPCSSESGAAGTRTGSLQNEGRLGEQYGKGGKQVYLRSESTRLALRR